MEKLKTMWNNLSKKGKLVSYGLAIILILIIANAII